MNGTGPKSVGWHAKGLGGTCKCMDAFARGPDGPVLRPVPSGPFARQTVRLGEARFFIPYLLPNSFSSSAFALSTSTVLGAVYAPARGLK